jgi:hypothetical protein
MAAVGEAGGGQCVYRRFVGGAVIIYEVAAGGHIIGGSSPSRSRHERDQNERAQQSISQ